MSRPAPSAAIVTLGCKLNLADSEAMAIRLREAGWQITDRVTPAADAVIVNSCSVTHIADQKSRHAVRTARRSAPAATVAFTGCMVETATPQSIDALGAHLVFSQPKQTELAHRLIEMYPVEEPVPIEVIRPRLKTRAFISVQEGCDDVCAFCIIPKTRGRERSKGIDEIVAEAQAREAEGAKEIVLTGTQLGAYGRETGERRLAQAIEALLRNTSVPRLRISSVQPQDLSPALIDLWRDRRLCRHLHLALQSGSESVLQRMRRRYSKQEYAQAVENLRAAIPDVAITTDVIAGFPGETETEFAEGRAFCREMAFAAMHVFPYSQREGTAGAKMPGQLPDATKKARVRELIALGEELSESYRRRFVGQDKDVLWETQREPAVWEGLTDTYIRVQAASDADLYNSITPVRITNLRPDGLAGKVPA